MKLESKRYQVCSDRSIEWKRMWKCDPFLESDLRAITLFIVYNPGYTSEKKYWAQAIMHWEDEFGSHTKNYGYSNYYNTVKYILKAVKEDIEELRKGVKPLRYHLISEEEAWGLEKISARN